ncbi:MAG: HAD hydrolase-like protein [Acidobacteriota bacterium]|nr:HAD hydrolase-like protein [Acidobacteriota bacterium]MDH3528884.1 HAD hydrolase-like protein [Acidobacteriota bacterium]
MITTIGFDADDTLWHNERVFLSAKSKYKGLLARYHDPEWVEERLDAAEIRNIKHFGYGIKGLTLSMIETAVELTEGRIKGSEINEIIGFAREMLEAPVDLLEGVSEAIEALVGKYRLMVITKGDLFDQETKIARSGLGEYFEHVEIVSDKTRNVYESLFSRQAIAKEEFLMVGNSLKSDVLPVLQIGSNAVHIPYETEWFHEKVDPVLLYGLEIESLESIRELGKWLDNKSKNAAGYEDSTA